ncbi:MAG: 2TM domain-containing protein [Saprospiraceae bacterium]|nr:2TM domain-containing protein [Saprospiraceae bacterium]
MNALFFGLNMIYSPHRIWFLYPLLGWGLGGLLTHYLVVFGLPNLGILGSDWVERETAVELERIRREKDYKSISDKLDKEQLDLESQLDLNKQKELRKNYDEGDLV